MRRAAKVDANHTAVVTTLRMMGVSVQPLTAVGDGCPDLLCAITANHAGVPMNFLVEIKDGDLAPSRRRLNELQAEWHDRWRTPVHVVESTDDAEELVRVLRGHPAP